MIRLPLLVLALAPIGPSGAAQTSVPVDLPTTS